MSSISRSPPVPSNVPSTNSPSKIESDQGKLPVGTKCENGWFMANSQNFKCPPTEDMRSPSPFPKVIIVGAGIAGLTVAYEMVRGYQKSGMLSEKDTLDITVIEKESYAGGKIIGYFRESNDSMDSKKHGPPVEHSTRIYGCGYTALFSMIANIPSKYQSGPTYDIPLRPKGVNRVIYDDLVGMNVSYINASNFERHDISKPDESPYKATVGLIKMLKSAKVSSVDIRRVLSKFSDFMSADYQERLSLTAGLSIGEYLDYSMMSPITQEILNSYIGIIVAARVQCDAYAIMTLFEALGTFGSPKTLEWIKSSGIAGGNMFPGPSSNYLIQPIVKYLVDNGVKFKFNTKVDEMDFEDLRKEYDAVFLALPHMVTAQILGPSIFPANVLHNEWSFGVQYYVTDLDDIVNLIVPGSDQNYYNTVLGSPWQIVYCIEYSEQGGKELKDQYGYEPFWGTESFGSSQNKQILATITATISNQYHVGVLAAKPVLWCTPEEILSDILVQIGVDRSSVPKGHSEKNRTESILKNMPSFGSVLYMDEEASKKEPYNSPEWLKGPVQANNYLWLSNYTLFITTPADPTFGANGMCSINNMYSNPCCTDINNLPNRLTNVVGDPKFHYSGMTNGFPAENNKLERTIPTTFEPVPDRVYICGEFCATPNLQIPTMEKACESGKVAAQKFFTDFGIRDLSRATDLLKGIHPPISHSVIQDNYVSASTAVQVAGIERPSDLVSYVNVNGWDKFRIGMYTGFHVGFPSAVVPITISVAVIFIIIIVFIILAIRRRKAMKHLNN